MAVALLVRRYYVRGVTPRENLLKLVAFLLLIIASSMGISAYWGINPNGWIGYTIAVPIWFLATLCMSLFLKQQREARVWGVPLVPWLPSMSIAINIFLMGSLDSSAFTRFGICTGTYFGQILTWNQEDSSGNVIKQGDPIHLFGRVNHFSEAIA
ncbi:Catabolite repression protein cat5 [Stylosanthes scabra]|uniref:Catabolite repression protein cat5 n=1 Tax=Stylosanthes scabra TaxID=79078 RepID=A0ABU6T5V5_9FABA|nr:Catabolite repression protein cat5 [Stylosanthes scabra]